MNTQTPDMELMRNKEYLSKPEGAHIKFYFTDGEELEITTARTFTPNYLDTLITSKMLVVVDTNGETHIINSKSIRNAIIKSAMRCGACGALMEPIRSCVYEGKLWDESITRCSCCGKRITINDDNT